MSDIVERLRERWLDASRSAFDCANCGLAANDIDEVADEIERLRAERTALRADAERVRGLLRDASHAATWGDAQALIDAAMTAIDAARKGGR